MLYGLAGSAQTYDNLPSGFLPYGTQYYKNASGTVLVGTSAGKFRVIASKSTLDSLNTAINGQLALKLNKTDTVSLSNRINKKTDFSLFQKDTANSIYNYHFNGYLPVYTPKWVAGIGGLTKMNDSTLFTAFRTNTSGKDAQQGQGIIQLMKYNTNTHKWTDPITIYTDPSGYDVLNSTGQGILSSGRMLVFFRRYNLSTSSNVDVGFIYSDNGGVTWSSYTAITAVSTTTNTYGKIVESGGLYLKTIWTTNKCEVISSTNGITWSLRSVAYNVTSPADGSLAEPMIERIGTDSIFLTTRTANGRFWNYLSVNNGASFSFVGKLPLASFPMASAISPEAVYIDDRKEVVVFGTGRILQSSSSAFTRDKTIMYAAPVSKLTGFKIINEIERPNPAGASFGGYTSTVKLGTGKYFQITTDYTNPDSLAVFGNTFKYIGFYSSNIQYSNSNLVSNPYQAQGGYLRINDKNGNMELVDRKDAFYYDQVSDRINPLTNASFYLAGKSTGARLFYNSTKSALGGGINAEGSAFTEGNTGLYSFKWGENVMAKGGYSAAIGSQDTVKADYGIALGRGAISAHTGAFVLRGGNTISTPTPALYSTSSNQFSAYFSGGFRFFTDPVNNLGMVINSDGTLQAPVMVNPIVGTQTQGDNSTKGASTGFVKTAIDALGSVYAPASGSANYAPVSGGTGYIQNLTGSTQTASFNISGSGIFGSSVRIGTSGTLSSMLPIVTTSDATIGTIVRGFSATQSADLQRWQSSGGSTLAKIDAAGNLTAASLVKTGGTSSQVLMADGSVSALPAAITASNGNTKVANDIQLGGTLTAPTTIETGANAFNIQRASGTGGRLQITSTGAALGLAPSASFTKNISFAAGAGGAVMTDADNVGLLYGTNAGTPYDGRNYNNWVPNWKRVKDRIDSLDAMVVHKAQTEIITGFKNFSNTVNFTGALLTSVPLNIANGASATSGSNQVTIGYNNTDGLSIGDPTGFWFIKAPGAGSAYNTWPSINGQLAVTSQISTVPYLSKTANYTVLASDWGVSSTLTITVNASGGNVAITLPTSSTIAGKIINVKRMDNSVNTVTVSAGTNIDGATTLSIPMQYGNAQIQSISTQFITL